MGAVPARDRQPVAALLCNRLSTSFQPSFLPSMSSDLTVVPAAKNLTPSFSSGNSTYAETARMIAPAFERMKLTGVEYIMAKLHVGYQLALIRNLERGALKTFIKVASSGVSEVPAMSKWALESSLAMFDQFLTAQGWNKKEVQAIEAKHQVRQLELDLWTNPPPQNANELIGMMRNWALVHGLKQADEGILTPEGEGPETPLLSGHQSPGADMSPEAVRERMIAEQAESFERFQQWLATDAFFNADAEGKRPSLDEVEAQGLPQTLSLLPDTALNTLLKTCEEGQAAIKYILHLRNGGTSARTRKPSTAKGATL